MANPYFSGHGSNMMTPRIGLAPTQRAVGNAGIAVLATKTKKPRFGMKASKKLTNKVSNSESL